MQPFSADNVNFFEKKKKNCPWKHEVAHNS